MRRVEVFEKTDKVKADGMPLLEPRPSLGFNVADADAPYPSAFKKVARKRFIKMHGDRYWVLSTVFTPPKEKPGIRIYVFRGTKEDMEVHNRQLIESMRKSIQAKKAEEFRGRSRR